MISSFHMMRIFGWKNMLSGHFFFFIIQLDVRTQIQLANGRALKSIFSHLFLYKKGASWKVKFIYSEKATHFCEISTVNLSYVVMVKSTVDILQKCVAFSEYMNFTWFAFFFWLRFRDILNALFLLNGHCLFEKRILRPILENNN